MRNLRHVKPWHLITNVHCEIIRTLIIFAVIFSSTAIFAADENERASTDIHNSENVAASATKNEEDFATLVQSLAEASLNQRGAIVERLSSLRHERSDDVIIALQEGNLFTDKTTPPNIGISHFNGNFLDAITGEAMATENTRSLKRIPLNNQMRTQLRTLVAQMRRAHSGTCRIAYDC
jgi:urea transport system permease protein